MAPQTIDLTLEDAPILISDDEADVIEVAVKLSKLTPTPRPVSVDSDIQVLGHRPPPPPIVNLVSEDEDATSTPTRSSSKGQGKPLRTGLSAKSSHRKKEAIYQGPESSIKQDLETSTKVQTEKLQQKAESEELEDMYEHTTILAPYEYPPAKAIRIEAPEAVEKLIEPCPSRKRRYINIGASTPTPTSTPQEYYVWDVLRDLDTPPHFRSRPRFLSKRPRLGEALDMNHYAKLHQFRRAGGSINGILQHNGRVVVCSNTAGGNSLGETDPYNKPGTLISWCEDDPIPKILDQGQEDDTLPRGQQTHYAVHCIAYDPIGKILVSSSADKFVRTWDFDESDREQPYSLRGAQQYQAQSTIASPHELAFKPGTSILAVGEQQLTIQNLSEGGRQDPFPLMDRKYRNDHTTGAIAWGFGSSSSLILASSEPVPDAKYTHDGFHHAFDVEARTTAFTFDASEAGDALCIDPTGDIAALVTTDGVNSYLRLYDIRNRNTVASQTLCLEPYASRDEKREVNNIMFSPDSIYLAAGRSDNCTHIYDCRMLKQRGMLERRALYNFKHSELHFSTGAEQPFFGVVGVKWVQSRTSRLGLVTGGNDGCIRLWDPLHGSKESTVLAQADSDVAHFTLGDRFNGEHELIFGDSTGTVYIMDGFANVIS
ncbi:WD40-repeat-containing domain protein [Mycena galopus ATCC 62051]|nr:WD40-repeat-containing domain protein [Mycena galopus ATCC 62051]